jgi:hypothetical protein
MASPSVLCPFLVNVSTVDFAWGIKNLTSVSSAILNSKSELELELIQTQMAQKPMLRAEVGMRVRCANKASAG